MVMETLSLPQTPSAHLHSPTESLLYRRVRFPSWRHQLVPTSLSRGSARPSFGRSFSLVHSGNNLKVLYCQKREIPVLEASSMDKVYDALAERIVPVSATASNPNAMHIVALAGPPGAGKSTLATEVVKRVNKLWPQKSSSFDSEVQPPDVAIVIPMDGFHLYRSQLDAMENPEEAHARRGAPWTFDPVLLLKCLKNLRSQGSVYAPSFDHRVGDPVEDDIFVSLQHKVVIVEGNYLLLEEGTWKDISDIFDEKWFIDVDLNTAMRRVLKRHISTGMPSDVAKRQIEYNDRVNAELIMSSKMKADTVIRSIDM